MCTAWAELAHRLRTIKTTAGMQKMRWISEGMRVIWPEGQEHRRVSKRDNYCVENCAEGQAAQADE